MSWGRGDTGKVKLFLLPSAMHPNTCTHTCTYMHTHTHICKYIYNICICMCIYYISIYLSICLSIYLSIYTHTYILLLSLLLLFQQCAGNFLLGTWTSTMALSSIGDCLRQVLSRGSQSMAKRC